MRFLVSPRPSESDRKPGIVVLRAWIAVFLLITSFVHLYGPIVAQEDESTEFSPENLSLSGSASEPIALIQPVGTLRVFWWDRFDGVTMVEGRPGAWSDPVAIPIVLVERLERSTPDGDEFALTPISAMPTIVGDGTGTAHALWSGEVDDETGGRPLWYARMGPDEDGWSTPRPLAESAVSFSLVDGPSGLLHLVYIRDLDTAVQPAGLYYRQSGDQGISWSSPGVIHTSRYHRLLTPEDADLSLLAESAEELYVTWRDPHLNQVMLAVSEVSEAEGLGWREPVRAGEPETGSQHGRFLSIPDTSQDGRWLMWESPGYSTDCVLRQAPVAELLAGGSEGERVLEDLTLCPESGTEWLVPYGEKQVLWGMSGDAGVITLVVWNGQHWSEPQSLRLDFEDPVRQVPVYLTGLQAALAGVPSSDGEEVVPEQPGSPLLVLVGVDETNDVWAVRLDPDTIETVFAPLSPWSPLDSITQSPTEPGTPAVVVDPEGWVHILWSEAESPDQETTVLWYARWDNGRWSRPTVALRSPEGGAREPTFVFAGEFLHALWSGGAYGRIWYSRAFTRDAFAAGGWSDSRALSGSDAESETPVGSSPHMVAAGGVLHAVYAVPVNERRGIYYVASEDGGETWGTPVSVFDAGEVGWPAVDDPQLAVDLQGGLHVIWLRPALTEGEPAQGIYYVWSRDGGQTWSEPLATAEGAYGWPRIAVSGLNQLHLLWQEVERSGIWWHRWLTDALSQSGGAEAWAGWSRDQQVVGMRDVIGPVAWVPDGEGRLYLVGARPDAESASSLVYTVWEGERWELRNPLVIEDVKPEAVVAALQPPLGRLDVIVAGRVMTGPTTAEPELWHTGRAISSTVPLTVVIPSQPVTPTPSPTPTPEPVVTATPDLLSGPPPVTQSNPLPFSTTVFLAGGLAAVIVAAVFGMRLLWAGRR